MGSIHQRKFAEASSDDLLAAHSLRDLMIARNFILPSAQLTILTFAFSMPSSREQRARRTHRHRIAYQWQSPNYCTGMVSRINTFKKKKKKAAIKRIRRDINSSSSSSELIDFVGEPRHCYCFFCVVPIRLSWRSCYIFAAFFVARIPILVGIAGASVFVFLFVIAVIVVVFVKSLFWLLRNGRKDAIGAVCTRRTPTIPKCVRLAFHPSSSAPHNEIADQKRMNIFTQLGPHTVFVRARACVGAKYCGETVENAT